jgi:hypothetical protein
MDLVLKINQSTNVTLIKNLIEGVEVSQVISAGKEGFKPITQRDSAAIVNCFAPLPQSAKI